MSADHVAFAGAARALIGTPFRLHGRDPASGIDCVGLVHCALLAIGRRPPPLPHYTLRNTRPERLLALVPDHHFRPVSGSLERGDLL
ncbi:MAG: hypothetical protein WA989_07125, partial [Henriciella sp.]